MNERERPKVEIQHQRCPYCHDEIPKGEKPEVCPGCHALHHAECWQTHGACSACGKAAEPTTTPKIQSKATDPVDWEQVPICQWDDCEAFAQESGLCQAHSFRVIVLPALLLILGGVLAALIYLFAG